MASFTPPETLKRRAAFLRLAATGRKFARPGFVMQFADGAGDAPLKIGFTATKKLGNAVARNRAKRRLREAARLVCATHDLTGVELVLICRQDTATLDFSRLCASFEASLKTARQQSATP